jgi:hypothetical protein
MSRQSASIASLEPDHCELLSGRLPLMMMGLDRLHASPICAVSATSWRASNSASRRRESCCAAQRGNHRPGKKPCSSPPKEANDAVDRCFEKKLAVGVVKLAHHGSSANTTPELLSLIECKQFLISTSGDVFGRPDASTVDMVLRQAAPGATLLFNYKSETTSAWGDADRQRDERFAVVCPDGEGKSLILDL